jgi:hypothetical protein
MALWICHDTRREVLGDIDAHLLAGLPSGATIASSARETRAPHHLRRCCNPVLLSFQFPRRKSGEMTHSGQQKILLERERRCGQTTFVGV